MGLIEIVTIETMEFLRPLICAGYILPISYEEVKKSYEEGYGYSVDSRGDVTAGYVMVKECDVCFKICSFAVDPDARNNRYGDYLIKMVVERYRRRRKPLIAIANPHSIRTFLRYGFKIGDKKIVPSEHWGGRNWETWLACDREFVFRRKSPFQAS